MSAPQAAGDGASDWREGVELRHHLAAAALVRALTTAAPEDWLAAAAVWNRRLSKLERLQLLAHAMRAADFNEAIDLMDAAVRDRSRPATPDDESGAAWQAALDRFVVEERVGYADGYHAGYERGCAAAGGVETDA